MATAKKKAAPVNKKPAQKKPEGVYLSFDNCVFHTSGFESCCAAAELTEVGDAIYDALVNVPEYPDGYPKYNQLEKNHTAIVKATPESEFTKAKKYLDTHPRLLVATTIIEPRYANLGQELANLVLPKLGFKRSTKFKSNGGYDLQLWTRVRGAGGKKA